MSKYQIETFTCPSCGKEVKFKLWESLNVQLDPEAKQRIIDGTFFQVSCQCGHTVVVDSALLFHDMERKTMIYYVDKSEIDTVKATIELVKQNTIAAMDSYRYRIVTSQNELREKVILLENDLDDRLIELVKAYYFVKVYEQHPQISVQEIRFYAEGEKYYLQFIDETPMQTVVPMEVIEAIFTTFFEKLKSDDDLEYRVDFGWATRFMNKNN